MSLHEVRSSLVSEVPKSARQAMRSCMQDSYWKLNSLQMSLIM